MIEHWPQLKSWFRQRFDAFSEWTDGPDAKVSLGRLWAGFGFIAVLALIGVSVWALYYFPPWYVNESVGPQVLKSPVRAFELENETRKTLTQIILGVFGLLVLYFTWRRVKAGDKTAAVAEQGHITERYTKAIEQLGKLENGEPNIEVRLGAIYALERIAIDSPRDQQTIMEVLCAYVRRNAVPPRAPTKSEPAAGGASHSKPDVPESPRIDIQAILTVIGRRHRGRRREKIPLSIDLSGAYLNRAALWNAHLERARLYDVHLEGAILMGVHLERVVLWRGRLNGAYFIEAHLEETHLHGAHLEGANFGKAHLERAVLNCANLKAAYLASAHMEGADLTETHMEGTYLEEARLEGADLRKAHLEGAIGLTVEQVKSAKNWKLAHYDPEFRRKLGLPDQ